MRDILLLGPLPNPTTGVSLANKIVVEGLSNNNQFKIDFINTSYNKFEEKLGTFSLFKALFYLKLNFYVYKILRADIVYVTPGQTFFGVLKYSVFILLSNLFGKELIIHVHGNYLGKEYTLLKGFKKLVFKWILNKATKGIVLSESLKGNMSPFIEENNIFVLHNFVENFLCQDKKIVFQESNESNPRIIFLSNLMQEKGILDLLEALKILEAEGFTFEAKIAGNIDAKNKIAINKYFHELRNVEYCGIVSGNEKKDLLNWGNIFVLPTYYEMEGQPISILEAMATANLILTTNHAGIADVFQDGINGFYVEKKNPMSIVSNILKTVHNCELSNSIRIKNFLLAKRKYSVNNFISNFINIIES